MGLRHDGDFGRAGASRAGGIVGIKPIEEEQVRGGVVGGWQELEGHHHRDRSQLRSHADHKALGRQAQAVCPGEGHRRSKGGMGHGFEALLVLS